MRDKNDKKRYVLVVLLLLLIGISIGYAALTTTLNIKGTTTIEKASWDIHFENLVKTEGSETATVEAAIDTTKTLIEYTVTLAEPGDYYEFTVDMVNNGTIDAMISEVLKEGLSTDQEKYIEYTATYSDGVAVEEKDYLKTGTKENIKVRVKYRDDIAASDLPTENQSLSLKFMVTYVQADETAKEIEKWNLLKQISKDAVLDNIASTYVTLATGIDFSRISSDTNGKGIYLLSSTASNTNPIFYFRGAVDNNNVKFANFCWKIVRTTETGGIKIIYNGRPDANGNCTNRTGEETEIGVSQFGLEYSNNAYVGYMYGTPGATTYEEIHRNSNNSPIRTTIDNWYKTNMISYTSKLEDTVWCNDRSVEPDNVYPGNGTNYSTRYKASTRLDIIKAPSLECININDRFTVNDSNGNGALAYPIALLTADEVSYAGGTSFASNSYSANNSSYYLYTNRRYWLLSPHSFIMPGPRTFAVDDTGAMSNPYTPETIGVRPAVSLVPGTVFSDGDGTATAPYIVE